MASSIRIAAFLVVISISIVSSYDLLSRYNRKKNRNNQPVVLVLDNAAQSNTKSYKPNSYNYGSSSDEHEAQSYGHLSELLQLAQSQKYNSRNNPKSNHESRHRHSEHHQDELRNSYRHQNRNENRLKHRNDRNQYDNEYHKSDTNKQRYSLDRDDEEQQRQRNRNDRSRYQHNRNDRYRQNYDQDRYDVGRNHQNWHRPRFDDREDVFRQRYDDREDRDDNREYKSRTKNALRSPIVKSLLRISNDLRCGARDECQDECDNNFDGKKKDACEDKCEVKFDCEEEDKDECAQSDNECGEKNEIRSTKGELFITEKPTCTRCKK